MSTSAFGDFSRERADRAWRLLEESEEHCGSNDVQASRVANLVWLLCAAGLSCLPQTMQAAKPTWFTRFRHATQAQKYVECIEFSDQMYAIFQDGEQPREGLTAQQKQQASSLLWYWASYCQPCGGVQHSR